MPCYINRAACGSGRASGTGRFFRDFLALPGVAGPVVADAYHAALAVEHDCDWVTNDADFARFPGLRWIRPSA